MFVENYRLENVESIMTGGDARPIPYPKMSEADWRVWNTFLPVRSVSLDKVGLNLKQESLLLAYGIPYSVTDEIQKATEYFDAVEVWRKREIDKDPIAVGVLDGDRYMIARWGMEKLIPFSTIKNSVPLILAWKYLTSPAGAMATMATIGLVAWAFLG